MSPSRLMSPVPISLAAVLLVLSAAFWQGARVEHTVVCKGCLFLAYCKAPLFVSRTRRRLSNLDSHFLPEAWIGYLWRFSRIQTTNRIAIHRGRQCAHHNCCFIIWHYASYYRNIRHHTSSGISNDTQTRRTIHPTRSESSPYGLSV
ncbi:hypothetical protein CC86DRAFT_66080 [Ophiobolus disseminans]|uniref:Secreted protein n=1 Tax=Ophiobolus disseminans TaxID=1469910 RepID=A0A6A6ZQI9_9PLEO|nr:hypothetical protein CC86DRAFT_66080 [Ophiobolus disseminans]